jgi:hypothetical protein
MGIAKKLNPRETIVEIAMVGKEVNKNERGIGSTGEVIRGPRRPGYYVSLWWMLGHNIGLGNQKINLPGPLDIPFHFSLEHCLQCYS